MFVDKTSDPEIIDKWYRKEVIINVKAVIQEFLIIIEHLSNVYFRILNIVLIFNKEDASI